MAIIDSIQLSGTVYTIQGSGGNNVVELTQAQYDALVDKNPTTFYIITDATAGDLTQYWTSAQTQSAITSAVSGKASQSDLETVSGQVANKQDTLVSGTNIKTINNESLLGSGNIDIQGGGKAIEAGRGIAITTGATADTVSFDLPIYKTVSGTAYSLVLNTNSEPSANIFKAKYNTYINCINPYVDNNSGSKNLIMGEACSAMSNSYDSFVGGYNSKIGDTRTFAFGSRSESLAMGAVAFGYDAQTFKPQVSKGYGSFACGGGTSANTQCSFATGYRTFTTRRSEFASGQYNNSVSATTTFGDSGNTLFSVGNGTSESARHNAFEIRQNGDIYLSLNGQDVKLQDQLGGGGASYSAGTGIDITNNVISVSGVVETSAITTSVTSSSTDTQVPSAKAVYDAIQEGGGGTVSSAITSGDTNAVAGGAVFNAVNYVNTTEDWNYVEWAVDDETKVSEEINNSIIKISYDTSSLEPESSASFDVTFEGDEQVYTITFYNTDDPEPYWDLDAINDYLDNYDWDGGVELTITANTPFNVVSASTDAQLLMGVDKYSETTTVTSVKDKVNISVNGASINGHNNIIELVTTLNNGNQANTSIGLYDLKTTNSGQLATDIKVPLGSGVWTAVTFVDSATRETEEINASQVKITLTGTPSQDNSIYIQDGDENWQTIMYDDDAWRNDTSFLSEITVSGNDLYLTASEDSTIKKLAADENPELIDSVEKFIEQTQDLIPYVQETKSDLGGLKLVKLTQVEYDALVTKDNSTLYVIVN